MREMKDKSTRTFVLKINGTSSTGMISCFMNTQGIFCRCSELANFTLISDRPHMLSFDMALDTCGIRRAVLTIGALPFITASSLCTICFYHF